MSSKGVQSEKSMPVATHSTARFIVVHGDKGGVGKSLVSQAIADFLLTKGVNIGIIEADTANPDVARMFGSEVPSLCTNLRTENGWMDLMDFIVKNPDYTFVVNTPAGIGESSQSDIAAFAEFVKTYNSSIEMELWWVMNVQHDSVNLFNKAYSSSGHLFSKIRVVCNLHFSDGQYEPFFLWQESQLRTRLEKTNGMTIRFPGLNLRVVKKLYDPANIMPFSDAADAAIGERVNLMTSERWKLLQWMADVEKVFIPAFNLNSY